MSWLCRKDRSRWREGYARHLLHIDFRPTPDTPFEAELRHLQTVFGLESRVSPGTTFRDAELVKDGDDSLSVVVALSKTVDLELGSNRSRLKSAEATVIPHWLPASIGSESGFTALSITIPRAELLPLVLDLNTVCMRRVTRNSAALLLLRNYCEAIGTDRVSFSPEMQRLAQRHFYELAAFAMNEPVAAADESEGSAVAVAPLAAARTFIAAHFRDPALNLTAVAKALNVSPRSLPIDGLGYARAQRAPESAAFYMAGNSPMISRSAFEGRLQANCLKLLGRRRPLGSAIPSQNFGAFGPCCDFLQSAAGFAVTVLNCTTPANSPESPAISRSTRPQRYRDSPQATNFSSIQ